MLFSRITSTLRFGYGFDLSVYMIYTKTFNDFFLKSASLKFKNSKVDFSFGFKITLVGKPSNNLSLILVLLAFMVKLQSLIASMIISYFVKGELYS